MSSSSVAKIKVVVIGSGAAGIAAARWLQDNDINDRLEIVVLEARNRIGGRVHTSYEDAGAQNAGALGLFDLGASWLHEPSRFNPISNLAERMQIPLVETDWDDEMFVNLHGDKSTLKEMQKCWAQFQKVIFETVKLAHKSPVESNVSLEAAIVKRYPKWKDPMTQAYASTKDFEFGAPLYCCSLTQCIDKDWIAAEDEEWNEDNSTADQLFLTTGFSILLKNVVNSGEYTRDMWGIANTDSDIGRTSRLLNIKLNHIVKSIQQDSSQVNIATTVIQSDTNESHDVTFIADAVICTLPLGVLKDNTVQFDPPLSVNKLNAIQQVGFGNVVKVIFEFKKIFWPRHVTILNIADPSIAASYAQYGSQQRGMLTHFLNGHKLCGKKILVGYGLGDAANIMDEMSDEEILTLALSRLSAFLVAGHTMPVAADVRIVRTRWRTDPFAKGTYSYCAVGNPHGLRHELAKREGQVFFAGEATNESSLLASSVRGAWESGIRAGREVIESIGGF